MKRLLLTLLLCALMGCAEPGKTYPVIYVCGRVSNDTIATFTNAQFGVQADSYYIYKDSVQVAGYYQGDVRLIIP